MTQELHYTSAPRGLKPGTSGFCTVAATSHMPGPLVDRLESLSGYRQVFPPSDPKSSLNPVVFMHLRLSIGGKVHHILSRVASAGLDHTQRTNKYAHHLVLEEHNLPEGGPAWLVLQPGVMDQIWGGDPRLLPAGRSLPQGTREATVCTSWAAQTGDAGWAGVVADSLVSRPERTIFLVFDPGIDLLSLIDEALALLPPSLRWRINFSTYYTGLPADVPCVLRGVLAGSNEAIHARRVPGALILDLTGPLGQASEGPLVDIARTGQRPHLPLSTTQGTSNQGRSEHLTEPSTTSLEPEPAASSREDRAMYAVGPPILTPPPKPRSSRVAAARGKPEGRSHSLWIGLASAFVFFLIGTIAFLTWHLVSRPQSPTPESGDGSTPLPPGPVVSVSPEPGRETSGFPSLLLENIQAEVRQKEPSESDPPRAEGGTDDHLGSASQSSQTAETATTSEASERNDQVPPTEPPGPTQPAEAHTGVAEAGVVPGTERQAVADSPAVVEPTDAANLAEATAPENSDQPQGTDPPRVLTLNFPLPSVNDYEWRTILQAPCTITEISIEPNFAITLEPDIEAKTWRILLDQNPVAELRAVHSTLEFRWLERALNSKINTAEFMHVRDMLIQVCSQEKGLQQYLLRSTFADEKPIDLGVMIEQYLSSRGKPTRVEFRPGKSLWPEEIEVSGWPLVLQDVSIEPTDMFEVQREGMTYSLVVLDQQRWDGLSDQLRNEIKNHLPHSFSVLPYKKHKNTNYFCYPDIDEAIIGLVKETVSYQRELKGLEQEKILLPEASKRERNEQMRAEANSKLNAALELLKLFNLQLSASVCLDIEGELVEIARIGPRK